MFNLGMFSNIISKKEIDSEKKEIQTIVAEEEIVLKQETFQPTSKDSLDDMYDYSKVIKDAILMQNKKNNKMFKSFSTSLNSKEIYFLDKVKDDKYMLFYTYIDVDKIENSLVLMILQIVKNEILLKLQTGSMAFNSVEILDYFQRKLDELIIEKNNSKLSILEFSNSVICFELDRRVFHFNTNGIVLKEMKDNHNVTYENKKSLNIEKEFKYLLTKDRNKGLNFQLDVKELQNDIVFSHDGVLSTGMLWHMQSLVEYSIENKPLMNRVLTISTSLMQNMINYAKSQNINSTTISSDGTIVIERVTSSNYKIFSKNIISLQDKEIIESKFQEILSLDELEIKKRSRLYRFEGGLGFYDMVRLSTNWEYNIKEINSERYIFEFNCNVAKNF